MNIDNTQIVPLSATADTTDYKQVYDDIYQQIESYNFYDILKNNYVDRYAQLLGAGKSIVDVGCGEGIHLKRLLKNAYSAFGVEISQVCCDKHLQHVPHSNSDILSFAEQCSRQQRHFAGLLCFDVLEHIPLVQIDSVLTAIAGLAPNCLLGIANHSDILNGVELHLIQQGSSWWQKQLAKHYKYVQFIVSLDYNLKDDIFFIFYCANQVPVIDMSLIFADIRANYMLQQDKLHLINEVVAQQAIIKQLNQDLAPADCDNLTEG